MSLERAFLGLSHTPLLGPDHYNGFFDELMPPFCLGTAASAVGDDGTPAGALGALLLATR
jgi:2,3-dihydroxyphenylpropionate 1,2-dioxygenase